MRYSTILVLVPLIALAKAISPAATEIANNMYGLKDKVTELANYVQNEDDMGTMSAESACEDMISSIAEQVTENAGSFTSEDRAVMVPAFAAAAPMIANCLDVLTAKAPMVEQRAPYIMPMVQGAVRDLQLYANDAYGGLGDVGLDGEKAVMTTAFEQCIAAYPSEESMDIWI